MTFRTVIFFHKHVNIFKFTANFGIVNYDIFESRNNLTGISSEVLPTCPAIIYNVVIYESFIWWTGRELNPRPFDCESNITTTELPALC